MLRSRVQTGDGNIESDLQWRKELEESVGTSCLQASVVLGSISTTLSALEALKPGDILYFKKLEFARLQPNGIPAFDVHVGTIGAQIAVQIAHSVVPGNQ